MKLIMHVPWDIIRANSKVEWTPEDRRGFPGIVLKDREPTKETLSDKGFTVNGYSY